MVHHLVVSFSMWWRHTACTFNFLITYYYSHIILMFTILSSLPHHSRVWCSKLTSLVHDIIWRLAKLLILDGRYFLAVRRSHSNRHLWPCTMTCSFRRWTVKLLPSKRTGWIPPTVMTSSARTHRQKWVMVRHSFSCSALQNLPFVNLHVIYYELD